MWACLCEVLSVGLSLGGVECGPCPCVGLSVGPVFV